MQTYIEKELFLLSVRHAFMAFYFLVFPFIVQALFVPSPLLIAGFALFIVHHLLESIIWFYKSRNIRKRQSGDLSKRGHVVVQLVQRIEQLIMLGFVLFLISELVKGGTDIFTISLSIFLLMVVFLHHVQFYYFQIFFKSMSGFSYFPSLKKARPSYIARERKALKRS
ncbi:hypothetical protein CEY02_03995 [Bacillus pumilus]|uniref:Uncharacterized protein n=1 Tax=Bacillus pumilus TaxID=1408 RepID=A0A2A5IZ21_BACPU|nr:hypothetical protein [Bacillus pumilus]PCK22503.1 hypothetical protein CEY02_03995 [Bacillus pumilus]